MYACRLYLCIVMKKGIVILLSILYLAVSTGFTVNFHYCMGDLANVEWGTTHDDTCAKCGMKDTKGCCETKYQVVKVQDEHQLAKQAPSMVFPVEVFPPATPADVLPLVFYTVLTPAAQIDVSPPGVKRHLLLQVFRI